MNNIDNWPWKVSVRGLPSQDRMWRTTGGDGYEQDAIGAVVVMRMRSHVGSWSTGTSPCAYDLRSTKAFERRKVDWLRPF